MKKFSTLQLQLLRQLAKGDRYSGNALGEDFGVSRTAIWKNIQQLTQLGLAIKRFPQQGYQLTVPMIPLDEQTIRYFLQEKPLDRPVNFHLYASLESTNQFLKELPQSPMVEICCAEKQTQGRGRFGRHWVSPFGENIYCSSRWELNCCLSRLSGLSLVVGLALLAGLHDSNIHEEIKIKWPNDLLWKGKKLGGILIEVMAETHSHAQVIIGIGINVNTATLENPLPDKPWCSLYEITAQRFDRNLLLANLIYQLDKHLEQFLQDDFTAFMDRWQQVDYLNQQVIQISQPTGFLSGQACGVNELGQLCLKDSEGTIHYLSSGETSLK